MNPTFQGEAQFLAWGDGPAGPWVKLLLPESDDLAPFRGMTAAKKTMAGQRLAVVVVEIGDDEQPKEPEPSSQSSPLGPLALLAVRWCKEPWFIEWCEEKFPNFARWSDKGRGVELACRRLILSVCHIESRKDLDTDRKAADTFHREIREPFME